MDKQERIKAAKRRIRELAERGLRPVTIARSLGMSRQCVSYHMTTMGLERGRAPMRSRIEKLEAAVVDLLSRVDA